MVGSLHYMSPEQVRGKRATPQSDLYSFAVTFFELIAGELPLKGSTSFELMNAHLHQIPPSLIELRPEIPMALSDAIAKALSKDPADRFATADEFLLAIQGVEAETLSLTSVVPSRAAKESTSGKAQGRISSTTEQMPEALEEARRHLAQFIGPIAKVVIRRLAPNCEDMDQLYREAAKEISSESERQRFQMLRPTGRYLR
jgi:serine/threonine-protein kinase